MNPASGFDVMSIERELPRTTPKGLWNLLCLCAMTDPKKRPDFAEIVNCLEVITEQLCIRGESSKKVPTRARDEEEEEDEGNDEAEVDKKRTIKTKKKKKKRNGASAKDKKKQKDLEEGDGPSEKREKPKKTKEKANKTDPTSYSPRSDSEEFPHTSSMPVPLRPRPQNVDKRRQTDLEDEGGSPSSSTTTSSPKQTMPTIHQPTPAEKKKKRHSDYKLRKSTEIPGEKGTDKKSKSKRHSSNPRDKPKQEDLMESDPKANFKSLPAIPVTDVDSDLPSIRTSWPNSSLFRSGGSATRSSRSSSRSSPKSTQELEEQDAMLLEEHKSVADEIKKMSRSFARQSP